MDNTNLKKNALSGFIWKFMERVMAQLVSLVVTIVIARILTPDDYSVVSIVTIFFNFANVIISGGLNTALIQKKDADDKDFSTILVACLGMSIILYIILFGTAPLISIIYSKDILIPVTRVMGITLIVNAYKSVICAYISNKLDFKKFFWATFGGTVVSGIVGIGMALMGYGAWALVAQQMTNAIIDTCILKIVTKFRCNLYFSFTRFKQLFNYGWKIFLTNLLDVTYNQASSIIIGLKFTPSDLAFYTKGRSFPILINSTLSDTFSAVLFPVMSKVQDDKDRLLAYLRRFMQLSTYFVFPVMIGFYAISDNFILAILTDKWMQAIYYVKIFCVSSMFAIITKGNLQVIKAIGRSDILLILEIIKKVVYFSSIIIFVVISPTAEYLALESIVASFIALAVNTYPNRKLIGYRLKWQIFDILPNLIISIIMGVIVYNVQFYIEANPLIIMCIQIVIGIMSYLIISLIVRPVSFQIIRKELLMQIKRVKK